MNVILLVEDNPTDEKLTVRALRKANLANEIVVARDGQEALDYLFGQGAFEGRDVTDLPSVVLLDLNLPKVGGLEVLNRLRSDERTKILPVVVLTSSTQDEDILGGYSHGANAYVRKQVDFEQFAEAAKTLGLFWLVVNQLPPKVGH
jgi:two-component system, response regulator